MFGIEMARGHVRMAMLAGAFAIAGAGVGTEAAGAAGDPVASGKFRLSVSNSFKEQLARNGVVMKPKALSINSGELNPLTGTGTLTLKGSIRFRHGKRQVVYRKVTAKLDSNGFLKGNGVKLFSLRGGKIVRNGFGAEVTGVKAKFLPKAARKINHKLDLHSLRRVSAGEVFVSEQPETVEVTGGKAHLVPNPDLNGSSGTLASRLPNHCIFGLSGVAVVSPGQRIGAPATPTFDFPLTGGSISPEGTDGAVDSAGGVEITNTHSTGGTTMYCDDMPQVPLATLRQTDYSFNLLKNYLSAHVVVSGTVPTVGDRGVGIGSNLYPGNATVSADPDAHTVTIKGIVIRINGAAALVLNQTFRQPEPPGYDPNFEFASGLLYGTVDLTVTTR
jgi:hypothetical protein